MARTGWYSNHPRSCTCYWCNEGRRNAGARRPFWRRFSRPRRERPTTPLPDWMPEGLNEPTPQGEAEDASTEPRPSQRPPGHAKGGFGRMLMWAVVIAVAAGAGWVAATQFGAG